MNISLKSQLEQFEDWSFFSSKLKKLIYFDESYDLLVDLVDKDQLPNIFEMTNFFIQKYHNGNLEQYFNERAKLSPKCSFNLLVNKIEKKQVLNFYEINHIVIACELIINSRDLLDHFKNAKSQIFNAASNISSYIQEFRRLIDLSGTLDYNGHPRLRSLFEERRNLERRIRKYLNEFIKSEEIENKVQSQSFDLIHNKYIIPIKSDSYSKNLGTIISRSESGNTLYVEPTHIKKENIHLQEIENEIDHIIDRLEYDFSKKLFPHKNYIHSVFYFTKQLDQYIARALFAVDCNLSCPELTDQPLFKLVDAFYPLISDPITNNITLESSKKGLVISGPNTGGKSITLKIVYLTQLFIRMGLFIPCREGKIFIFDGLHFFSGDRQSIANNLSSFAAEVMGYVSLSKKIKSSNLIVIDEIFNTTSSEEASALAMTLFNELTTYSDTKIIVSTHHQTLKTFLDDNHDFVSAHVTFDTKSLEPTYKLVLDSPGSSHAIDIFNKLTKSSPLEHLSRLATRYLDNNQIHYEKLLSKLARKEHELNQLIIQNKELNKDLKNQKQKSEGLLKLSREKELKEFEKKVLSFFDDLQKRSKNLSKKKFVELKSEAAHFIQDLSPPKEQEIAQHKKPDHLVEGKYYYSLIAKQDVKLQKITKPKKEIQILVNGKILKCPYDSLMYPKSHIRRKEHLIQISVDQKSNIKMEYDCRGMRYEEFENTLASVESYLLSGSIPFAIIIHGHGTGVLKNKLKKFVNSHHSIIFDKDESGNDGASRLILKS